jgi:hypothetical protein
MNSDYDACTGKYRNITALSHEPWAIHRGGVPQSSYSERLFLSDHLSLRAIVRFDWIFTSMVVHNVIDQSYNARFTAVVGVSNRVSMSTR